MIYILNCVIFNPLFNAQFIFVTFFIVRAKSSGGGVFGPFLICFLNKILAGTDCTSKVVPIRANGAYVIYKLVAMPVFHQSQSVWDHFAPMSK